MRYNLIANRQPIIGCLFLFVVIFACAEGTSKKQLARLESNAVLIEYAGNQRLEQGDFISINGHSFYHDSLYLFRRKSTDTVYLPTQRYVADQPPGGRPVYSTSNALASLMQLADALWQMTDTTQFKIDGSRIPAGQLRIYTKGKKPVEVITSSAYPLRVSALKD